MGIERQEYQNPRNGFYTERCGPHMSIGASASPENVTMVSGGFLSNNISTIITLLGAIITLIVTVSIFYAKTQDAIDRAERDNQAISDIKVFIGRQDQINQYLTSTITDIRNDVRSLRREAK